MSSAVRSPQKLYHFGRAGLCVLFGALFHAVSLQVVLSSPLVASSLMSERLWPWVVNAVGGRILQQANGEFIAEIDLGILIAVELVVSGLLWVLGACWIKSRKRQSLIVALSDWGFSGWLWWLIPGAWEAVRLLSYFAGWPGVEQFLLATPQLWYSLMLAGWLATLVTLCRRENGSPQEMPELRDDFRVPRFVWLVTLVYVIVFTAMNWQLYRGLWVPHGDSAMYEEHLWNITHGKGFRSYLDQGLFLGEHIQVAHLLLLPVYLLWPSHLLLEFSESLALASGAIPVFWIARRHTASSKQAGLLAAAYLLYFPLQFLDISIDLKTFRPISFGVPAMLFALDRLERGHYRGALILLVLALTAKEDFAIIIAPLGVWMALRQPGFRAGQLRTSQDLESKSATGRTGRIRMLGIAVAVFGVLYLYVATRVAIPWFRGGSEVHYAGYFSRFGTTLEEITWNMLSDPSLLFGELLTLKTVIYAMAILLPLGFVPLFSPGRLLVGGPLFVLLCLNQLAQDPRHHFHAPLIPIVFWAAAAGIPTFSHLCRGKCSWLSGVVAKPAWPSRFVFAGTLTTGIFFSLSPLGIVFWDSGSRWYWESLYLPGKRAEEFSKVFEQIPQNSRVASTDFIHPRFTHHERSYDYSGYRRKISGYELQVPKDTEYIVIDTQHPYSTIKVPEDVREYREEPDKWELLPDVTDGYFIVLKRKRNQPPTP